MPSRPYAAARLTIDGVILTSLHLGTGAADLAARVAEIATKQGARVRRRLTIVTIRAPDPVELRERLVVELRERLVVELRRLGVLATCHDAAEPGPPDVEIDTGDPCSITLRPRAWAVATVEQLRAYLDPTARTRQHRERCGCGASRAAGSGCWRRRRRGCGGRG